MKPKLKQKLKFDSLHIPTVAQVEPLNCAAVLTLLQGHRRSQSLWFTWKVHHGHLQDQSSPTPSLKNVLCCKNSIGQWPQNVSGHWNHILKMKVCSSSHRCPSNITTGEVHHINYEHARLMSDSASKYIIGSLYFKVKFSLLTINYNFCLINRPS